MQLEENTQKETRQGQFTFAGENEMIAKVFSEWKGAKRTGR